MTDRAQWFALVVFWLISVTVGCGGRPPFAVVPVSGRITYADGRPIDAAVVRVVFVPQIVTEGGNRPAETVLAPDGSFAGLTTVTRGDGAIPGRYCVIIQPTNADGSTTPTAVAGEYLDVAKTPLKAEVTRAGPNRFEFMVNRPASGKEHKSP